MNSANKVENEKSLEEVLKDIQVLKRDLEGKDAALEVVRPGSGPQSDSQIEDMDLDNEGEDLIHTSHLKEHQASDMKTRLKDHPRKGVDSVLMQTPWTKYSRGKKKKRVKCYVIFHDDNCKILD